MNSIYDTKPISIQQSSDLIKYRWKTEPCAVEGCWRCIIVPMQTIVHSDTNEEAYIWRTGCLAKELVEHIVEIHNQPLNKKS